MSGLSEQKPSKSTGYQNKFDFDDIKTFVLKLMKRFFALPLLGNVRLAKKRGVSWTICWKNFYLHKFLCSGVMNRHVFGKYIIFIMRASAVEPDIQTIFHCTLRRSLLINFNYSFFGEHPKSFCFLSYLRNA